MPSTIRNTSLLVLLGAQQFPEKSGFRGDDAFGHAHNFARDYFIAEDGFGLPQENLLDLFDTELNATAIFSAITDWLQERVKRVKTGENRITDLFLYYIGHGALGVPNDQYFLAIRSTMKYDAYSHSLTLYALAAILREFARGLRSYVIIDACFAGAAVGALAGLQGNVKDIVTEQINKSSWTDPTEPTNDAITNSPGATRGTALLCASGATVPAKFKTTECTYFTGALIEVLRKGAVELPRGGPAPKQLSLRQLNELITRRIITTVGLEDQVLPQVHSPRQDQGGDIADDGIFPNPGAVAPVIRPGTLASLGKLIGHEKHVDCVAWSPDGLRLATGSYDNSLRIWDAATFACSKAHQGHARGISDVAWSPDSTSSVLATASYDHSVRRWKADSGEIWKSDDHTNDVRCLTWAGGGLIVSGASDGWVHIWTMAQTNPYQRVSTNGNWINAVAWCDATETLAIGLGDGDVLLHNPLKAADRHKANCGKFTAHHDYVNALAWMPQTNLLCSGSGRGTLRIWDIQSGKNIVGLDQHLDKILRVSFSPDGRLLASIGQDRLIIWNTHDWKPIHTLKGPFPTKTYLPLAFSPIQPTLAVAVAGDPSAVQLIDLRAYVS